MGFEILRLLILRFHKGDKMKKQNRTTATKQHYVYSTWRRQDLSTATSCKSPHRHWTEKTLSMYTCSRKKRWRKKQRKSPESRNKTTNSSSEEISSIDYWDFGIIKWGRPIEDPQFQLEFMGFHMIEIPQGRLIRHPIST